jgi:phosphoribosyl 1,2-cyclic phosphodiesterase
MLRFASLGSGSKGNGTLIECGSTRILIDCGFTLAETERRLQRLGCSADSLSAILVTHEHGDHAIGVGRLSRRYQIPVCLTVGTFKAVNDKAFAQTQFINLKQTLAIGDLEITPFSVPHDAREPCQFIISDGDKRLGVLTDTGSYTDEMLEKLQDLHGLMLECNYETDLLTKGPYPYALKERVSGRYGHLSNQQAVELLKQLSIDKLQCLVGMHLSEINNLPQHAHAALCKGVGGYSDAIKIASQQEGLDWHTLS